jgi:hypothetical protein
VELTIVAVPIVGVLAIGLGVMLLLAELAGLEPDELVATTVNV